MEFSVQTKESLKDTEKEVAKLKDAWKIEFVKKDSKDQFRFKALTTKGSQFEKSLDELVKQQNWKLVEKNKNKANLEEIFLKLAGEDE